MSTVTGVVQKVSFKDDPAGKWRKISVQLDDNEWYGLFIAKDRSDALEAVDTGYQLTVEYEIKGKWRNASSMVINSAGTPAAATTEAAVDASTELNQFQLRRLWSDAWRKAQDFVLALNAAGTIKLGTKGKEIDAAEALIRAYAKKFAEDQLTISLDTIYAPEDTSGDTDLKE